MELNPPLSSPAPFAEYAPPDRRFDESFAPDGGIRPGWKSLVDFFNQIGHNGLVQREQDAQQAVKESGATFFAADQAGLLSRPWQLSTIPFVMDSETWSFLDLGLTQRVRLLEAILNDLLGQQRLLRERVLPAALLSANPYYSRTFHGLPFFGFNRLNVTATDLARDDDGTWWVTGDRTRAPSGLGYLLENRIVTSRVLPQLIRQTNVTRLASFFSKLRHQMNSLAPHLRDNPRVAILTPGEHSYRYFEDTYLARYLGYTLVQGRDLAVRGGKLNLKTLGGLLPIEVLWRHVSDQMCDPLELAPHSHQGVTGLLRCVRSGSVAVANAIGSMLVQMPAMMPFLSSASEFLFSEKLKIPTIPTYWCGGEKELQYVLDNLDQLMLRPAFAVSGTAPIMPAELTTAAKEELVAAVRAKPHQYIAQRQPARSTTPVWHEGRLRPWHVALRSFHVQSDSGVDVLPGGLVRVSPDSATLDGSPSMGALGQDCWVIGDSPVDPKTSLLPPANSPITLTRSGAELPSRVAEHLFWLGRYAERTEACARLLRTTLTRLSGENWFDDSPELPRLVAALAAIGQIEPDYAIEEFGLKSPSLDQMLPNSIFDQTQRRGLQSSMIGMINNAAAVRDRISLDAHRIVAKIGEDLSDPHATARRDIGTSIERVNGLLTDLLAFAGLISESVTRTHGWRFLHLGRRIERTYQTAELLAATLCDPIADERPLLEAILRVTDSLMTYRSRYLLELQPAAVIDLLINDDINPRSIGYQVEQIAQLIDELPTDHADCGLGDDQLKAESLRHRVRMSDPSELATLSATKGRQSLRELLESLIKDLPELSDAITARYLIHTAGSQTLTGHSQESSGARPKTD